MLLTGLGVWAKLWFSFCAKETDEEVGLLPNLGPGLGAEFPCRFVLALSSSAQGAGGGRSPISGGGRKDRAGFGAVGGGATGLSAGGVEYWFGNFGLKGPLVSISDSKSVRESSCLSKLVCFSIGFCGATALIGTVTPKGRGGGGGGGGGEGQMGAQATGAKETGGGKSLATGAKGAGGGKSSATGGGAGKAGASPVGVMWKTGGGGAGRSSSTGGGGGGGGKSSQRDGGGGGRSPTRPITAVLAGVGDGAEGGV